MKNTFFLKLGIAIVAGFGLLLAGFYVYEPVWFKIQEYRLLSDDPATVDYAASAIAEKGRKAYPYISKWLNSESEPHIINACKILAACGDNAFLNFIPQLEAILSGPAGSKIESVVDVLTDKKNRFIYFKGYLGKMEWGKWKDNAVIKRNICVSLLKPAREESWRNAASEELIQAGNFTSVLPLIEVLESDVEPLVRSNAAEALGNIGDRRAIVPLIKALENDSDILVRRKAADALDKFRDKRAVPAIIAALFKENDSEFRRCLADNLFALDRTAAAEPFIKIYETDKDETLRSRVFEMMGLMHDSRVVMPMFKEFLKGSPPEQIIAYYYIDYLYDKRLIEPLIKAFETPLNPELRLRSASMLARSGDPRALRPFLNALAKETDNSSRIDIIDCLAELGNKDAIDALMKEFADAPSREIRWDAAWALICLGEMRPVQSLAGDFIMMLNHNNVKIRESAAAYLGCTRDKAAVEPLLKILTDDEKGVKAEAIDSLLEIGDNRACDKLFELSMSDNDNYIRCKSAYALVKLGDARGMKLLLDLYGDNGNPVDLRMSALSELRRLREVSAIETLLKTIQNCDDESLRCNTLRAIADFGDNRALPQLFDIMVNDNSEWARFEAAVALTSFDEMYRRDNIIEAVNGGNNAALLVAAWYDGKYIATREFDLLDDEHFKDHIKMRWGDIEQLRYFILHLPQYDYRRHLVSIFKRMPEGFPVCDFKTDNYWGMDYKQARQIRFWFWKNESRLAWDAEKRKYYLKPE
jgi:HEAT repeat protein